MADERAAATGMVVVGYDGSPHGAEAVRFALAEGARRGSAVRVVTAHEPPETWAYAYGVSALPDSGEAREAVRQQALRGVEEIRAGLDGQLRGVPVEVVAVVGPASVVLPDAARGAELLVVGHRGRGGLRSALLGSVGLASVLTAPCPVTVVPAVTRRDVPEADSVGAGAVR